jgi:hypothetical protein
MYDVSYPDKENMDPERAITIDDFGKNQIGLIAQEVEKTIPEVVVYNSSENKYGMAYTELIPILIKAVQEQQESIEQQTIEITRLLERINQLEGK